MCDAACLGLHSSQEKYRYCQVKNRGTSDITAGDLHPLFANNKGQQTVYYCRRSEYCMKVLLIRDKFLACL
jgi:hypothetical protein